MRHAEPDAVVYCQVETGKMILFYGFDGGEPEDKYTHAELLAITDRLVTEATEARDYVRNLIAAPALEQARQRHAQETVKLMLENQGLRNELDKQAKDMELSRMLADGGLGTTFGEIVKAEAV